MLEEIMSMLLRYLETLNGDEELGILGTPGLSAGLDEDC